MATHIQTGPSKLLPRRTTVRVKLIMNGLALKMRNKLPSPLDAASATKLVVAMIPESSSIALVLRLQDVSTSTNSTRMNLCNRPNPASILPQNPKNPNPNPNPNPSHSENCPSGENHLWMGLYPINGQSSKSGSPIRTTASKFPCSLFETRPFQSPKTPFVSSSGTPPALHLKSNLQIRRVQYLYYTLVFCHDGCHVDSFWRCVLCCKYSWWWRIRRRLA